MYIYIFYYEAKLFETSYTTQANVLFIFKYVLNMRFSRMKTFHCHMKCLAGYQFYYEYYQSLPEQYTHL